MKLTHINANLYIPDGIPVDEAIARTTHFAVGAHQDDLEVMAYNAIEHCYGKADQWFGGVVVTDGAGSARQGAYANYSGEDMGKVRVREQRKAAVLGEYSFVAQLGYSSAESRSRRDEVVADLESILRRMQPQVVYVHNPADKHDTHVAVFLRTLEAIRRLEKQQRPQLLYGVEVWRGLDWLDDADKVLLRTDQRPNLAHALMALFDSQISGGKRYDLALPGRRLANATFFNAHAVDALGSATLAIDLSELLDDDALKPTTLVERHLQKLQNDIFQRLDREERSGK